MPSKFPVDLLPSKFSVGLLPSKFYSKPIAFKFYSKPIAFKFCSKPIAFKIFSRPIGLVDFPWLWLTSPKLSHLKTQKTHHRLQWKHNFVTRDTQNHNRHHTTPTTKHSNQVISSILLGDHTMLNFFPLHDFVWTLWEINMLHEGSSVIGTHGW